MIDQLAMQFLSQQIWDDGANWNCTSALIMDSRVRKGDDYCSYYNVVDINLTQWICARIRAEFYDGQANSSGEYWVKLEVLSHTEYFLASVGYYPTTTRCWSSPPTYLQYKGALKMGLSVWKKNCKASPGAINCRVFFDYATYTAPAKGVVKKVQPSATLTPEK